MLENLKLYLGISDTSQDNLLNLLISMAQNVIKSYCNYLPDEVLPTGLDNAILQLAATYYKKRKNDGISSQTQGSRSVSFIQDLPEEIKIMCAPFRKIRLMG
jgi:hypothetical protein